jgi:hypothetical protein
MTNSNRGDKHKGVWAALLIGAPLYLYLNLFSIRGVPYLLGGDQIFFWVYAQRMLFGEQTYLDFFEFTPPGTSLFYLALFKLFGPHIWVTNAAVLLPGTALCWICFSIARRLMERALALIASFLFLAFIYGRLLNATHHWFSLLAALLAVRALMPSKTPLRMAAAGVLLGVASCFTQTAGVAVLLAVLLSLAWDGFAASKPWKHALVNGAIAVAAFSLTLFVLNIPLLETVGWRQLWYYQVIYPRQYLAYWFGAWFPGLPEPLAWHTLPRLAPYLLVYALLPVVYPAVLWYCWRNRRNAALPSANLVLLASTGLFLLLEILPGVNFLRVYCISMPGLILLVWMMAHISRWRFCVIVAGWVIVACAATGHTWSRHNRAQSTVTLPAGKVILSPQKADKFLWLAQYTRPEEFLFQPAWPESYIPLGLRNPTFVDSLIANEETRPEFVDLAMQQLDRRQVKYILWSPQLNSPNEPARSWKDNLGPLRDYLFSHYTRVHTFSDQDEIWQRK